MTTDNPLCSHCDGDIREDEIFLSLQPGTVSGDDLRYDNIGYRVHVSCLKEFSQKLAKDLLSEDQNGKIPERAFNQAVITELKARGRTRVASMSASFDAGMSSLSSTTVAREEELQLTEEAVQVVADKRIEWFEEHEDPEQYS
jgi:hypothetical protein